MLSAGAASADDQPWQTRIGVSGHLGFGTPLGVIGVELDVAPLRWLSVDAGVGANAAGAQLVLGSRIRALRLTKRASISFEGTASVGPYTWLEDPFFGGGDGETEKHWNRAYWLNGDVGFEVSGQTGWYYRFYFGIGRVLNDEDFTCPADTRVHCMKDHANDGEWLRYVGVMFGKSISP